MQKLTAKFVESIACPKNERAMIVRDSELKGFGLRVTPGSKSYIVESRVNGKSKRLTVGRADLLSVDEGRKKALCLLSEMASGIDPSAEAEAEKVSAITLGEVLDHYLSIKRLRPGSSKNLRGLLHRHLQDWLSKPLSGITPEMVQARHKSLSSVGYDTANSAMKKLRMLFNFAADNLGVDLANPVRMLTKNRAWFKLERNPVIIPDHFMACWWKAVATIERPIVRDFLLLLMLTGLRRNEALTLRWQNIDLQARTLTIPADASKNFREHSLPLSDFLLALLVQRKEQCGDSAWVFPRGNGEQHMANPQETMEVIAQRSGCKFSPHACRRTLCTLASRMGIPHHLVRKILNHNHRVDVTSTYIVLSLECLREPMQQITDKMLALMECDPNDWLRTGQVSNRTLRPPTLAEVLRRYFLEKKLRLTTQTNYEKAMRLDFGDWLEKPVTAITESMVEERKKELFQRKSPVTVNLAFGILRAVLNFAGENYQTAIGESLIVQNPVHHLEKYSEASYKRTYLDDSILPRWYEAVQKLQWSVSRDHLVFCLMTGLRKNEAMTLGWTDVDLAAGCIQVRGEVCKNGRGYGLPLSQYLLQFLRQRKQLCGDSKFVFPGRAGYGRMKSCQRAVAQVSQAIVQEFDMSQLRRTFIRAALQAGVPADVARRLVNQIGARDNFESFASTGIEQLRAAMESTSERLLGLMGKSMEAQC